MSQAHGDDHVEGGFQLVPFDGGLGEGVCQVFDAGLQGGDALVQDFGHG